MNGSSANPVYSACRCHCGFTTQTLGLNMTTNPQTSQAAARRPRSLREVALWGEEFGDMDHFLREFLDQFYTSPTPADRAAMLDEAPPLGAEAHRNLLPGGENSSKGALWGGRNHGARGGAARRCYRHSGTTRYLTSMRVA